MRKPRAANPIRCSVEFDFEASGATSSEWDQGVIGKTCRRGRITVGASCAGLGPKTISFYTRHDGSVAFWLPPELKANSELFTEVRTQHNPFSLIKRVYGMTKFRPCIDLHDGQVKQIVGGTLRDDVSPVENFVSSRPPGWFASKYASDGLTGGHVIKLGPGNDEAAKVALSAFPGGMQVGGGISSENAGYWLDCGASHVIITSWLFSADGKFRPERLSEIRDAVGAEKLVIDLSCRRVPQGNGGPAWCVAMNRWQKLTNMAVSEQTLTHLAEFASEFLVHAADVEGLCGGIDHELVAMLGRWGQLPITYAGGAASMQDVQLVDAASGGKVDVTVGSALDIFGGQGMKYAELVEWNGRK